MIGVTDLLRGEGVGISADGIFRRAHAIPARGLHANQLRRAPSASLFHELHFREDFRNRRVSHLVAVSGAFPGAFGSTQATVLALKALIAHARANKRTVEGGELRLFVGDEVVSYRRPPRRLKRKLRA